MVVEILIYKKKILLVIVKNMKVTTNILISSRFLSCISGKKLKFVVQSARNNVLCNQQNFTNLT